MLNQTQVFRIKPDGFHPTLHAAGAYVTAEGKLLFLQIADLKKEKDRWGVPAGKIQNEETPQEAMRRELFEETGIFLEADSFIPIGELYIPDILPRINPMGF